MTAFTAAVSSRLFRPAPAKPGVAAEASVGLRVLGWSLGVLAGLAVWTVVFALGLSGLQEQHIQKGLYTNFRTELAEETGPLGGAITRGAPVALLASKAGKLQDLTVVEGTTSSQLRGGPGHYPGTPLPGQAGDATILGRGTSFGAPFAGITALEPGDTITATTTQGVFHYVVLDVRAGGQRVHITVPPGGGLLTLVTAEGAGWRSGWAPTNEVSVDAVLEGPPAPAPPQTTSATPSDQVMAGDSSGLYPLVLWLQLLGVAAIGIAWGRARWGRWQSWVAGVPVVLAALWGASNALWQLLPNLL
jgi:sortase A